MLTRPWVLPQEVRDYSERQSVIDRSDERLAVDISRAEQYVIRYTRNPFDDPEQYSELPAPVRIAVILIAEAYAAYAAGFGQGEGTFKSESFDDYSYTAADTDYILGNLDLGSLLDEFVKVAPKTPVMMSLRKL